MTPRQAMIARQEIATRAEKEIAKIVGTEVDVVVMAEKMMVTTYDISKVSAIKEFLAMVGNISFSGETFYEADEDDPEAMNIQYAII